MRDRRSHVLARLVASRAWIAMAITACLVVSRPSTSRAASMRELIEADWLRQVEQGCATAADAAGAVDGIKNGKFGFHTAQEANPWWQVDLGSRLSIGRIVIYNRLDYAPGLHNADALVILTSDDGNRWTQRHDNRGVHFGGVGGAKPLEVTFPPDAVAARYVRLQVRSAKPVYFHLDEVEIYASADPAKNVALGRPAEQSSVSQWSQTKRTVCYDTAEVIIRARRLAAALRATGVDPAPYLERLDELARQRSNLPDAASVEAQRSLYLKTRWVARELAFANPRLRFDRLLFVKRFGQETYPDVCLNHMPWVSRPGGDICVLSGPFSADGSGQRVGNVLQGALGPGHVHGIDLWWDGSRVVFGYAKAKSDQPPEGWLDRRESYRLRRTEEPIHLFEIGIDGRKLRQLTGGEWSDLDPTYLPNGDIAFVSERCGTSLQCNEYDKDETSCNLYVMRGDGSGIRRLSANKDGDYLPHTLDDGSLGYTRWEYHERSWAFLQTLWTIRPDGTQADAIFKQHFVNPWGLEDVRSIPDTRNQKLVCVATGHHTLPAGPVVVVTPGVGINEPRGMRIVTPGVLPPEGGMDGAPVAEGGVRDSGGHYMQPWPLSAETFLVSYSYGTGKRGTRSEIDPAGYALYLIDVFGTKELLYRDPAISCFAPIPLRARPRPPVLADMTDPTVTYATCSLSEASYGCEGIRPERVRYLRIAEPVGWPYDNQRGGQRYGEKGAKLINWTPIRILGDVPVERDGSAHFRVPADTAVYFQLLDENRMELRRMRSFISFQPGESRACVGCHESRSVAPRPRAGGNTLALARGPSDYLLPPWGERPVSFLRDIQPILDRHCVACHSGLKPQGGLDFCGGLTDWSRSVEKLWGLVPGYGFNRAFETIVAKKLVAVSDPNLQDATVTPPLAYGAHHSKLITALGDEHHRAEVRLSADERLRLAMWIDANAPYHDRFVDKRPATPAYDLAADRALHDALQSLHAQRCAGCHDPATVTRLDWIDIHDARRSLFLAAPLAKAAGGTGKCSPAVYADTADPQYRVALALVASAVSKAWAYPRRDLAHGEKWNSLSRDTGK